MIHFNKKLMQNLKDIKEYEEKETDITVVGGMAIVMHFPKALINTYDVDVITNNPSISQYGVSTDANNIKETYGDYKIDRIKLNSLSNDKISIYVIGKERLIASKLVSNRLKDGEHIKEVREKYDHTINWNKVNAIKEELQEIFNEINKKE